MTALGIGVTDRDPVTVHDGKPSHSKDTKPGYLVRAQEEMDQAWLALSEAADKHETGDPNNSETTMKACQRALRIYNRKVQRWNLARLRYTEDMRKRYEYQEADYRDQENMYADLRHGG